MKTDALSDLLRDVDDDSSAEHRAIFHLATALMDIDEQRPMVNHPQHVAARALEKAAAELHGRGSAP